MLACCLPAVASVSTPVYCTHPANACLPPSLPAWPSGLCPAAHFHRSTYSKHPHKEPWVLTRVVGEPLSWDPLEAISPEHPPEAIVAAQVQALK